MGILLHRVINSLAIGRKKGYVSNHQLSPVSKERDGFFLKEKPICQSGILQFATLKYFRKGECYDDQWNC